MATHNVPQQERQPVLLLVDDSPSIHRLLAVKLRDENIEFLSAFSGEEGLDLASDQHPSLILCDLSLPRMDGMSFLKAIKEDPHTMATPVIMLSASSDSDTKVRCFELGAMDYVVKPFDVPELKARINSAIRITRLMKILEHRAQIDGLTGLNNRVYFDQRLSSELSSAQRRSATPALVMCDLDHFKKLNDTFGHPAGDEVLQSFSTILQQELRAYDIPCRYGGEEFALILPSTTEEEAMSVCERIRKALEAKSWSKYRDLCTTASFGVTSMGVKGERTAAAWIQAADLALYQAKSSGRNRVHAYRDDLHSSHAQMAKAG